MDSFMKIYTDVLKLGSVVSPRGLRVIEIEDYSYTLRPYERFQNFPSRKMNLRYIKDEFLWYVKGDRFDTSIAEKAKMWQGLINTDGSINSNYGFYLFSGPNQFDNVVKTLETDRDSRRASMMILRDEHLLSDTKDVPCTYSINFRIRDNRLNMSVRMRSQDCVYGMTNDAPAFSFIHEMMLNALRRRYPTLEYGRYNHTADSFHVYERHWPMLEKITGLRLTVDGVLDAEVASMNDCEDNEHVECPHISGPDEVDFIRALDFSSIPVDFTFAQWLNS
jgi:thymidylate synthase